MADYWIKLYIEMLDDPKIGTLPDGLCWRFVQLCLLAGRMNKGGAIPDTHQIAWVLRKDSQDLEHELNQLAGIGLIQKIVNGWTVTNFEKRQDKMTPAEKQKAYRARLHKEQYADDVTESVTDALPEVTQITDNRLQITDNRIEAESDASPFAVLVRAIETATGLHPAGKSGIDAINQMLADNVTPADIPGAVDWHKANKGAVRYYSSLVGPAKVQALKRIQGVNGNSKKQLEPAGVMRIGPDGEQKWFPY